MTGQGEGRDCGHGHAPDHERAHHHGAASGHGTAHDHHGAHGHARGHDHHHGVWGRIRHALVPHSHDAADSIDDALTATGEGIRAVRVSLVALGVTALVQSVIVWLSGSVALAADTIHNFSDALTSIPLWIAFALGRRAATRRYTHGFGRVEDVAGLVVVLMIALSAVVAAWEAIRRLAEPTPIEHLGWVAAAGVVGFLGNEAVALYRIRIGRRIGSAALVADGFHARADGLTSLAVVAGVAGVALGWPLADPIVGLLIAASILGILIMAARDIFARLLDGTDPALLDAAECALGHVGGVRAVGDVRLRWVGHGLSVDADVAVDPALGLRDATAVGAEAEGSLRRHLPRADDVRVRVRAALEPTG